MQRLIILSFVISLLTCTLSSQPTLIFKGGKGQGYTMVKLVSSEGNVTIKGGSGSGYFLTILASSEIFYKGGKSQGYAYNDLDSSDELVNALGGQGNGYDMELNYREFIWTGNVGEGWNVAGNWNYNIVPDINRKTIIPAGVLNWPYLNSGIFAIGENPDGGAFTTAALTIAPGAELTTRINSFVQNYGTITIKGLMTVKNSDANAFNNNVGGIISIEGLGRLEFDPN